MAMQQTCSFTADYSEVMGERILPFEFILDTEHSVLYPTSGQKQKFCYLVEGKGQDTSTYADLSHFLLRICPDITREKISSISVVVDGVEKTVVWGVNVEIKTPENPDKPTGCVGLKFDFGLDKVDGEMEVCIELEDTYTIGPVNVCIFGGNVTATGLTICGPVCNGGTNCSSVFYQKETVCVPVSIHPFATPGEATATCCGDPIVVKGGTCARSQSGTCNISITQELCIRIPIEFGATIETGEAVVKCGDVTEIECNCGEA